MSLVGNTFFLVFAILSGLVSVPPVRLLTPDDTPERKLSKNETDSDKRNAEEEFRLVLERHPRNALAGKPFTVQPCVRMLAVKDKYKYEQSLWPVEVSSKFSDKCHVEGKTNTKWKIGEKYEFTDLRIKKPASGCVLVFTLRVNGTSSQIQSSPFDVFSTDLVLTISSVIAKNSNQSNKFNLSFTFDLKNANQITNFPWNYGVSLHQPLSHVSTNLYGSFCSANFSKVPVTVTGCFLSGWGYRNRLIVKVDSNASSWSVTSNSAPFDAFATDSLLVTGENFNVETQLKGNVSIPSAEEDREQILANALNQLGVNFPQLQWTNGIIFDSEINGSSLQWVVKGDLEHVRALCKEIPYKKISWNNTEWVAQPINISNQTECSPEPTEGPTIKAKPRPIPWKTLGLLIVIAALLFPVCILFCIWPRREREIREKYQERLSRYVLTPEIKRKDLKGEENAAFQNDKNIKTMTATNSPLLNGKANRSSFKTKADFVQLKAAHLAEHNVPDLHSKAECSVEGPQRVHLLRSRPASNPTVVAPATAQYATEKAPSPDDSIENLARDILSTPNTITDTHKSFTAPIVTSFVKFRSSSDAMGSRISVSSIANTISCNINDRRSAETTLPEPQ